MQERIQKIISAAGIMSRRAAEELITEGRVRVNGVVVTELGSKADPEKDHIKVDGKLINPRQRRTYVLLNKPVGYVTTLSDPEQRPIVQDLLKGVRVRVYPVGRLDYNTEGLLLLTNDGDFAHLITHPSHELPKSYLAKIKGLLDDREAAALENGIYMTDGKTAPARVRRLRKEAMNSWVEITIHEGRKRQVRRMFDHVGHSVIRLKRVRVGNLNLGDLPPGAYRYLTPEEVSSLREMAEGAGQRKETDAGSKGRQAESKAPKAGGKGPRIQREVGRIPGPRGRSTKPGARGKERTWGQRPGAGGRAQGATGRDQRTTGWARAAGERVRGPVARDSGQRAESRGLRSGFEGQRTEGKELRGQRDSGRVSRPKDRSAKPGARGIETTWGQAPGARDQRQRTESRGQRAGGEGPRAKSRAPVSGERGRAPGTGGREKSRGQGPGFRGRGPGPTSNEQGAGGRGITGQRAGSRGSAPHARSAKPGAWNKEKTWGQRPGFRGKEQTAEGRGSKAGGEGASWQRPAAGYRRPEGRTSRPAGAPRRPRR